MEELLGLLKIPVREVVVGDVIHLKAGDLVPADCRLLSIRDLFVNEALLTGESLPREKQATPGPLPPGAGGLGDAVTGVFRGTSVVSGLGEAVVVRSGVFQRSLRHIPFGRIQNVSLHQNLLQRLHRLRFAASPGRTDSVQAELPGDRLILLQLEGPFVLLLDGIA